MENLEYFVEERESVSPVNFKTLKKLDREITSKYIQKRIKIAFEAPKNLKKYFQIILKE
ncbi:hypothetical protein J4411_02870 [Candidatus Pacearchaeota archaeon]|nr:hypothetical protein [Candidatus Pacearchaeota archaeon]